MITFTPHEFNQVRDAVAASHLFMQAICPLVKQRQIALNKDQRNLLEFAPSLTAAAFTTLATVTHRNNRDPDAEDTRPVSQPTDIDTRAMYDELENVSALVLPDLVFLMLCALAELPMYDKTLRDSSADSVQVAPLMAWAWEAGRRYALNQALAIFDSTANEYKDGTEAILTTLLNSTLDLSSPGATPGLPSAADLDAVADEHRIAHATSRPLTIVEADERSIKLSPAEAQALGLARKPN